MLESGIEDIHDSYVSQSMDGQFLEDGDYRGKKVRDRLFREKPFKSMYVCMATDVDVDVIKDGPYSPEDHYTEHVLAIIRIFSDGLIEMTPQISTIVEEINGVPSGPGPSNLFLNDETVAAGMKKGMRLSAYRVRSKLGSEFEYTLSNSHGVQSPLELEEMAQKQDAKDALAVRQNRGGDLTADESEWKQDPPSAAFDYSLSYFAEIVSASGFGADRVFVDYEVLVPEGWNLRTGNLSDGVAEKDMADIVNISKGVDDAELRAAGEKMKNKMALDGYDDGEEAMGALRGATQVARVDATRGGVHLPILRPKWRGKPVPFALDAVSRAIWAGMFFFTTVLSVILGIDYPMWIVPGLIFLFSLGTGYQGGVTQALIGPRDDGAITDTHGRQDLAYAGTHSKSISKYGTSFHKMRQQRRSLVGALVAEPKAHFNHLVNLSFDAVDSDITRPASMGVSQVPTMVFTVYSQSFFGKINVEGYGYTHLPAGAGSVDVEIGTWKPVGGISAEMKNYFLGSGPRLKDRQFVFGGSSSEGKADPTTINRFGVRSENSGSIRFRCNTSTTDPRRVVKADAEDPAATGKVAAVRRTVDDILKEYRAGASVAKSIEAASIKRGSVLDASRRSDSGSSSDILRSSSNGSLLARRAEMLIAQAKSRLGSSGSVLGASSSRSTIDVSAAARSVLGSSVSRSSEGLDATTSAIADGKEEDPDDSTPLLGTRELKGEGNFGASLSGTGTLAPLRAAGGTAGGSAGAARYDSGEESDDSGKGLISRVDGEDAF
jgi:hypothetical protein